MMNKKAQYLLASVVESSQDSIVTIDLNRIITSWNKAAEKLYGYAADEVIGLPLETVMLPQDIGELINKVNAIVHEITVPIYETIRVHKSGKHTELEIMLSPVRDMTGEVIGISTIARDITVRKLQEQQKDEFIAVASHELKSPLTSIKGYAELLLGQLEETGNEATLMVARKLDKQVDRLIELIKALLDTTKLAAGEMLLNVEQFDLNVLIDEQIEIFKLISDRHAVIFKPGVTKPVSADRKLIGQVLTNLISNAIKYSPNGGDIIITSAETPAGIKVSVRDFGVGIPLAVKDRIFERYFRVTTPLTAIAPGMGLGLYITAAIIQQHCGTLSVQSTEGQGSEFTFTLPL